MNVPDPLWTGSEIVSALGGPPSRGESGEEEIACARPGDLVVTGISIDTRSVAPGDLFVALDQRPEGGRDGHQFVDQAVAVGAGAILADRALPDAGVPVFVVAETLAGLRALARAARRRMQGCVVGITGSSGKTTLRHFLQHMLEDILGSEGGAEGAVHASLGSLNNQIGVPLSLARMPRGSRFAVLEVGTNHPGEIGRLVQLVRPDVAVLLNVFPAHIGNFGNLDALRIEKLSISGALDHPHELVLDESIRVSENEIRATRCHRFGDTDDTVVQTLSVDETETGAAVEVLVDGAKERFFLPAGGRHRVRTALAALAVVRAVHLPVAMACAALRRIEPPAGRGQRLCVPRLGGDITIVDDSYNANPSSMTYALTQLAQAAGRKVAVLGEIHELGDEGPALIQGLVAYAAVADVLFTVGAGMLALSQSLSERPSDARSHSMFRSDHFERVGDAPRELSAVALAGQLEPGDTVLVKGSNRVFWTRGFVNDLVACLVAAGD